MKNSIKLVRPRRVSEYRHHYSTQCNCQPAELVIDPENEEAQLYVSYNAEIGGGMLMSEFHHREFRPGFNPYLSLRAVNKMLTACKPLAARVIAGYSVEWNGNNNVGVLTEDAAAALEEIERLTENCMDFEL